MRSRNYLFLLACFCFLVSFAHAHDPSKMETPRKWALLVGVNDYQNLQPLKFGRSDAERLYQVLTQRCGYEPRHITLITDTENETARRPLKHNIQNQLGRMLAKVRPEDHVLVFFTGHGFISSDGEGFLATLDTDADHLSRTALAASKVVRRLESVRAAQKLLILDSCLEKATIKTSTKTTVDGAQTAPPDAASLPMQFADAKGVVTFASCSPGQSSWELLGGNNGVFTHFLAKGLEGESDRNGNQNGKVELTELMNYTIDEVSRETNGYFTQQVPMSIFGPETEHKSNIIADQSRPYLILNRVGDQWNRKVKLTQRYRLQTSKRSETEMVFTRELDADHNIRFTVPAGHGRPQGSIAKYRTDKKIISGRKYKYFGFNFPDSVGNGELKSRVIRHSVDSFGSEAKFDKSDRRYAKSLNHGEQVPALASIHPIEMDEAILPQAGTTYLDVERLLQLIRKVSPDCDPVFEDSPRITHISEDYIHRHQTRFQGKAILNARVGTAEAHNVRMQFDCEFQVVYSHDLNAVVYFDCRAYGGAFENWNNDETMQLVIEIQCENQLTGS